jgi:hypothetical protein
LTEESRKESKFGSKEEPIDQISKSLFSIFESEFQHVILQKV